MSTIIIICNHTFKKVSIKTNGKLTTEKKFPSARKSIIFAEEYAQEERRKNNIVELMYL